MSKCTDGIAELTDVGDLPVKVKEIGSLPQILAGLDFNVGDISYEACDAHHLMHCYQLALDFGVPTAQRALAMYQSEMLDDSVMTKSLPPVKS